MQIDRLQHERQLRKTELKDVYNSFDTLLGLGGAVEVGTKVDALTEETTPRPKAIKVKSRRAARLKAEVQEMEEEVRDEYMLLLWMTLTFNSLLRRLRDYYQKKRIHRFPTSTNGFSLARVCRYSIRTSVSSRPTCGKDCTNEICCGKAYSDQL